MKNIMRRAFAAIVAMLMMCASFVALPSSAMADTGGVRDMYRVYNPNSGEHFYTADSNERDHLTGLGWKYEGIGWKAPVKSSVPVYRMYNPNVGDHHYTMNANERDMLVRVGWKYEGIGWYSSDTNRAYPLYRQYNPNAKVGSHNYTLNTNERDMLVHAGWNDEGLAWYGVGGGSAAPAPSQPSQPAEPSEPSVTGRVITPGAWCKKSEAGEKGVSKTGEQYVCAYHDGNKIPHWYPAN
ncbi:hypothetical protein [Bifidobacterium simiiventris]|uniref:hypothetical protein n=1 Tax=Bifidobacterium simiiventris TaxID=2834434 RepID=UPI001C56CA71|nr:hypothetical protein [Bifidobacterium simiiventris]MBW3079655.1 hypothetical protein [Bifidobacterium simiiventris]